MKILELCLSTGVGGLELYVARTVAALQEAGVEFLCVTGNDSFLRRKLEQQDLPALSLARANRHFPLLAAWRLARLIDREAVDIIHFHWGKDFLLAVWAKQFSSRRVKLVYTRQMMITRVKKDWFHQYLYRHLDKYITITDELKQLALSYLPMPAANIQRLYYGVEDPPVFDEAQRESLRESLFPSLGKSFLVGLVGRIEKQKGQYLLIQALQQLRAKGHDIKVLIVGPAMSEAYLNELKQDVKDRALESVVVFYGSHPNPIEIMPAFDALVLATRQETFGLVLIEAMRAGVAVLGTAAGGVPEIIDHGKTGLLFTPDDAMDLAAKLEQIVVDENLRQKLALEGKRKADRMFARSEHYRALLALFQEISMA